jgi:glycosyltransferase involved in cell wall biosynthesis
MRLVFYPPVPDAAALADLYHRAAWYLPDMAGSAVTFLLEDASLRPGPAPEAFGDIPPPSFTPEYAAVRDIPDARPHLAGADMILQWRADLNRGQRHLMGGIDRRVLLVDKNAGFTSHEAYRWAIARHELLSPEERREELEECRARFARLAAPLATERAYVFGTGPSLARAMDMDFSDGLCVVCNTTVCNRALLDHLRPRIVVAADPALHYGVSRYAHGFRKSLLDFMAASNALLLMPMGYHPLFVRRFPELAGRTFGVPVTPGVPENISMDFFTSYQTACYPNILPMFLLPVAATLGREVGIAGCDGRAPAEERETNPSPFWSHHGDSEQEGVYDTLKVCHPSFFMRDYQDWYRDHCASIAVNVAAAEAAGRRVTCLTRSFIPALAVRQTPALKDEALRLYGTVTPPPPEDPIFEIRRDTRTKPVCKVSVIVSLYRADRFLPAMLQNVFEQTLFARGEAELILIDSASPGNEEAVIAQAMEGRPGIFYGRTRERETIYAAWNRAIREARGDYVMNLGCDDRLRLDALEMFAAHLDARPDVGLVYGNQYVTRFANQSFSSHVRFGFCRRPRFSPDMMLHKFYFGSELMWRRSLHDQVGYFDESFVVAGDYEMACRFATVTRFSHLDRYFGLYFKNTQGLELSNLDVCKREDALIRERYKDVFPAPVDPPRVHVHYPTDPAEPNDYITIVIHTAGYDASIAPQAMKLAECLEYPHIVYSVDQHSSQATRNSIDHLVGEGIVSCGDNLLAHARRLFTPPFALQPRLTMSLLVFGRHVQIPFDIMPLRRTELTRRLRDLHREVSARFRPGGQGYDYRTVHVFSDTHETRKLDLAPHRAVHGGFGDSRAGTDLTVVIQHYAPEAQTAVYRQALADCVASVRRQEGGGDVRILVSDDGSHWSRGLAPDGDGPGMTAADRETLARLPEFSGLDVDGWLYKPRSGYFSKALMWNAAVRLSGAARLIFLDDDHTFHDTDALALYRRHLDDFALVIGNTASYRCRDEDGAFWTTALGYESPVVQGSNFGIRRELLERIGGFEDQTFIWGTGDDPILFWKLYLALRPRPGHPDFRACYVEDIRTDNPLSGRWREHCRLDFELYIRQVHESLHVNPYANPSRNRKTWVRLIPSAKAETSATARTAGPEKDACREAAWLTVILDGRGADRADLWLSLSTILDQHRGGACHTLVHLPEDGPVRPGDLPAGVRALTGDEAAPDRIAAALDTPWACRMAAGGIMPPRTLCVARGLAERGGARLIYGGVVLLTRHGHDTLPRPTVPAEPARLMELCAGWTLGQPLFVTTDLLRESASGPDTAPGDLDLLVRAVVRGEAKAAPHVFFALDAAAARTPDREGAARLLLEALSPGLLTETLAAGMARLDDPGTPDGETWPQLAYVHMMERHVERILDLVDRLRRDGVTRAAIYPAGQHTKRLLALLWPTDIAVACLLDDTPPATPWTDLPVLRPGAAPLPDIQAVVVSSKRHEEALAARCLALGLGPVHTIYHAREGACGPTPRKAG